MHGHRETVANLCLMPEGTLFSSGIDKMVKVWKLPGSYVGRGVARPARARPDDGRHGHGGHRPARAAAARRGGQVGAALGAAEDDGAARDARPFQDGAARLDPNRLDAPSGHADEP
eukprot:627404-Prymnesium_polylepis.2